MLLLQLLIALIIGFLLRRALALLRLLLFKLLPLLVLLFMHVFQLLPMLLLELRIAVRRRIRRPGRSWPIVAYVVGRLRIGIIGSLRIRRRRIRPFTRICWLR
jgi:hypothetical protein